MFPHKAIDQIMTKTANISALKQKKKKLVKECNFADSNYNKDQVLFSYPDSLTGGWWFNACGATNLNGRYLWLRAKGHSMRRKGILWKHGTGPSFYLKTTKIAIQPAHSTESFN